MLLKRFCLSFVGLFALNVAANLPDASNGFSHKIATRVFESKTENTCVSGASIHHALGMALMGTGKASTTRHEFLKVLGLNDQAELKEIASDYALMLSDLKLTCAKASTGQAPELTMTNKVVLFNGIEVEPSFLELTGTMGAQAQTFKKGTPTADILAEINRWVSDKTKEKIPSILSELKPDDVMVLLNAVYFKGAWAEHFSKNATKEANFTQLDKSTKKVHMMYSQRHANYVATSDAEILELPYGGFYTQNGPRFSMFFVLPTENKDFTHAYADFDVALLDKVARAEEQQYGRISIPKFKVETSLDLVETLKAMGMASAFSDDEADFTEISKAQLLKLGQAVHKTFIDISEKGTEAAAATAVTMGPRVTSINVAPPVEFSFVADRPFFFFIRDNEQKLVLFEGAIVNP